MSPSMRESWIHELANHWQFHLQIGGESSWDLAKPLREIYRPLILSCCATCTIKLALQEFEKYIIIPCVPLQLLKYSFRYHLRHRRVQSESWTHSTRSQTAAMTLKFNIRHRQATPIRDFYCCHAEDTTSTISQQICFVSFVMYSYNI